MRTITIRPNHRQLLSETFGFVLLLCATVGAAPFVARYGTMVNIVDAGMSVLLLGLVVSRYIVLRSIRWEIDGETLCREKGVFVRQKDYIELYRVVDYAETQTLLQRVFNVKTVIVMSTDRTDAQMSIYGVPARLDIVGMIRKRVENCKKEKRIYEITNN